MRKHDIHSHGFNVDPDQLTHDLCIAKLCSMDLSNMSVWQIYDAYIKLLDDFDPVIKDKIRYDSTLSK